MKNFLKIIGIAICVISFGVIGGMLVNSGKIANAQAGGSNYIPKMTISKGVSVSTTSVQLLPASSGRVYAVIVNDGNAPVYLSMDGNAAVPNAGVRINANGGSYEINFLNQDVGIINAITASGTSVVTVSAAQ